MNKVEVDNLFIEQLIEFHLILGNKLNYFAPIGTYNVNTSSQLDMSTRHL